MSKKRTVRTAGAPGAIGPYSQGIAAGGFLFISGQVPLDPESGQAVGEGIEEQVERVLENVKAILAAGGADLGSVVKTTVYLTDLKDFPRMNEVYGRYFGADPPARATVQVAALPRGVRIEVDAIAVL
jgi:2-iminobutanoate/2-iminopropanoate deaminase